MRNNEEESSFMIVGNKSYFEPGKENKGKKNYKD